MTIPRQNKIRLIFIKKIDRYNMKKLANSPNNYGYNSNFVSLINQPLIAFLPMKRKERKAIS